MPTKREDSLLSYSALLPTKRENNFFHDIDGQQEFPLKSGPATTAITVHNERSLRMLT